MSLAGASEKSPSLGKFGEHAYYDAMQLREVYRHDLPQAAIVQMLVFVPEDVADADDGVPRRVGMLFC
jgi:hypothetical protein